MIGDGRGRPGERPVRSHCAVGASETSATRPLLPTAEAQQDAVMEVRIVLDQSDPPVGRLGPVSGTNDQTVGFTGWLGLLRALSDALGSASDASR